MNIDLKRGKSNTWTNALQNRCYMCIQWTHALYSVVITNNLIHLFHKSADCVMNSRVSGQCSYTIETFYSLSETNIPSIFKKCTQASAVSYIDDFVLDKQWQLTLPSSWKTCTHLTQVLSSTLPKYIEVKITSKTHWTKKPNHGLYSMHQHRSVHVLRLYK